MSLMSKKVKRYVSLVISLSLIVAMLVACSSGNSTTTNKSDGAATNSKEQTQALKKLSFWIELFPDAAAIMKSYDEVTAWKVIQEKTGVDIEFEHPAQGQLGEQFNLMVAANKLPDVVVYSWNAYPGGAMKAISDKKIIPLNDYLEYAPNLKKLLDENPEWRKMASTDNGDIIGFPFIREDVAQQVFLGPAIRKDWLDKLVPNAPANASSPAESTIGISSLQEMG